MKRFILIYLFVLVLCRAADSGIRNETTLESGVTETGTYPYTTVPSPLDLSTSPPESPHKIKFERVVSFGSFCQTRWQIDRYLQRRFSQTVEEYRRDWGGAHIFDWTVIHSYPSLVVGLEEDLEHIFDREHLEATHWWSLNKTHIVNNRYRIGFTHLFKRSADQSIDVDCQYETLREKVMYLKNKFLELGTYNTLYVISDMPISGTGESLTIEAIRSVRDSLSRLRGAEKEFRILVVSKHKLFEDEENIFNRVARFSVSAEDDHPDGYDWRGSNRSWDEILDEFSFEPKALKSLDIMKDELASEWLSQ